MTPLPLDQWTISALGAVVGFAVKAFGKRAWGRVLHWPDRKLNATWRAKWVVDFPRARKGETYEDQLRIDVNGDLTITGGGQIQDLGAYKVTGQDSQFCVTLTFFGVDHREKVAGTALLRKQPDMSQMDGLWSQLSGDGELIGGSVTLTRIQFAS